jgi:hypothetical protein
VGGGGGRERERETERARASLLVIRNNSADPKHVKQTLETEGLIQRPTVLVPSRHGDC